MSKSVELLINRKWEEIPTDHIYYITISDKLSFLHLKGDKTVNLFITLSELEQLLPFDEFIRISRSCIVNYHSIKTLQDSRVLLTNGESLPFSKRRSQAIREGYQTFLLSHMTSSESAATTEAACKLPQDGTNSILCQRLLPLLQGLPESQLQALEQLLLSMKQDN